MADVPETDGQDVAEVFDEDNTNIERRRQGGAEDAEQFEDIPDVYDVTSKLGDRDDDEAEIGEDMDDDEIVSQARDHNDDDDDLEDDDLKDRQGEGVSGAGADDEIDLDGVDKKDPNEVELSYQGDLTDVAGASSSAADMESDELSDADLRELHYKD